MKEMTIFLHSLLPHEFSRAFLRLPLIRNPYSEIIQLISHKDLTGHSRLFGRVFDLSDDVHLVLCGFFELIGMRLNLHAACRAGKLLVAQPVYCCVAIDKLVCYVHQVLAFWLEGNIPLLQGITVTWCPCNTRMFSGGVRFFTISAILPNIFFIFSYFVIFYFW